ncbi:INO80 complex subunit B isoform X2 [Lycorma delicatula]|uniref:INO80 complex subunit B isoform X2 n=1 Tax=Lycorma delicatula TaxID=130591 RepID=UPI003F5180A6
MVKHLKMINENDSKKHKKHSKHKKHKKKKSDAEEAGTSDAVKVPVKVAEEESNLNKTFSGTIGHSKSTSDSMKTSSQVGLSPKQSTSSKKKKKKGKESGTSSEEERWLDAIESGKLEEVDDELKKIKPKDPNLMTARQRAMFERKTDKEATPDQQLLALPSGYREKVMTPEMVQKAAIKSQKRKQQADEKREKDKKKTMERLLRKQESKMGKVASRGKNARRQVPLVIYRKAQDGITVYFPPDMPDIPLKPVIAPPLPTIRMCDVNGCKNIRKYSCSKTGKSLCSLSCYEKNLLLSSV